MNITNEQYETLSKYRIEVCDDINDLLLNIDSKITEIGFNPDYSLNDVGLKLQLLYDQIYNQN